MIFYKLGLLLTPVLKNELIITLAIILSFLPR